MKLTTRAYKDDYYGCDVSIGMRKSGKRFADSVLKRMIKRNLAKVRRAESKTIIRNADEHQA